MFTTSASLWRRISVRDFAVFWKIQRNDVQCKRKVVCILFKEGISWFDMDVMMMPMSMDMPMTLNPIFFLTRRHFVSRSCSSGCRSLYFRFPRLVHSQPFIKQQRKDWWLQSSIVKNLSWLHCHWWLHYPSVPNPGRSWFDTTMSMSVHNSKICSKAFYGQYKIRHIRKFLSPETTKLLSMHSSLLTWTTAILFSMMSPITNLIIFRKY